MRVFMMALALCVLFGCGAITDGPAEPSKKSDGTTLTDGDGAAEMSGHFVPGALTDFQCAADDNGDWRATGSLKNSTDHAVTFDVTIVITDPRESEAASHNATNQSFDSIQAGGSIQLDMKKLQAPSKAKQCYVQVRAQANS